MDPMSNDRLVDRLVTYTLELDGRFIVVENVPARVDDETGERLFSPKTVERLHEIASQQRTPTRVIETPVFDFAA